MLQQILYFLAEQSDHFLAQVGLTQNHFSARPLVAYLDSLRLIVN